jgi:hypothetical protein
MALKKLVILAALFSTFPMPAHAQSPQPSVRQIFQNFGLIGVWAPACGQPASLPGGNSHAIYAIAPPDGVMLTYDNGPKYKPSVYAILTAQPPAGGRLTYVEERLSDKMRVTVTLLKFGNEILVWTSVLQDGRILIDEGKSTTSGASNPRQMRCGS